MKQYESGVDIGVFPWGGGGGGGGGGAERCEAVILLLADRGMCGRGLGA